MSTSHAAFLAVLANAPGHVSRTQAYGVLREMKELSGVGAPTRPDFISYSTVMKGFAQIGHPERANEVLCHMYDDFVAGNTTARPDLQCFNTVLAAYSKRKDEDTPRRAMAFLEFMKKISGDGVLDVRPDVYSMSSGRYISKTWHAFNPVEEFCGPFLTIILRRSPAFFSAGVLGKL